MYLNKKIGVVVPCYNESKQLPKVIDNLPGFVDLIVIVDDASSDNTFAVANDLKERFEKISIIQHTENLGVGAAIQTGYKSCLENKMDLAIVVGGDGQMDSKYFSHFIEKIINSNYDYVKAYRQDMMCGITKIPKIRLFGQVVLTIMTNLASGLWNFRDSQAGFTIANKKCLEVLTSIGIYERYGVPNDILIKCSIFNLKVGEIFTPPIYGIGESSKLKPSKVIFPIINILVKGFLYRVFVKNVFYQPSAIPFAYTTLFALILSNAYITKRLFIDIGMSGLSRVELLVLMIYVIANLLIVSCTVVIDQMITKKQNEID
jgi:glycosyltransferase involved in cell wall biosynthesis